VANRFGLCEKCGIKYTDGNMHELLREEYIKMHGINPMPVWEAVKAWRSEQIEKWKSGKILRRYYARGYDSLTGNMYI
jgi:hypothetical protein